MNKTQAAIFSAGEELFIKFGTRKVTIDEICRKAGISKMTFYKYFPNKIELAKAVLQRIAEDQMAIFREIMARDIPFEEKVREQIRMKLDAGRRLGEEWPREILEHPESEISRYLMNMTGEVTREARAAYEKAQKAGDIRADVRMDFIFYFLENLGTMLQDPRLLSLYGSITELTAELLNFFFWGILPRDKS